MHLYLYTSMYIIYYLFSGYGDETEFFLNSLQLLLLNFMKLFILSNKVTIYNYEFCSYSPQLNVFIKLYFFF